MHCVALDYDLAPEVSDMCVLVSHVMHHGEGE